MNQPTPTLDQIRNFEGKYPQQLWSLFMTEMWERFCFYGMRGMLTVFMVTQLGLDDRTANLQYGAIQAFVYAFTFIGGVFADKILGFHKSLFWGAPTDDRRRPGDRRRRPSSCSTSASASRSSAPASSSRTSRPWSARSTTRTTPGATPGFSLFYSGINLGALLGGILMVWVGKYHSWRLAFALVVRRHDHRPDQLPAHPEVAGPDRPLAAAARISRRQRKRAASSPPTSARWLCHPADPDPGHQDELHRPASCTSSGRRR